MINWFKNIFASKPDTETGAVEGGFVAAADRPAPKGGWPQPIRAGKGYLQKVDGILMPAHSNGTPLSSKQLFERSSLSQPLYQRVIDATNLTKPQYAVNFSLTKEERSARSRKAAATRKAKREMTARLNRENLRRALQVSVDAA